MSETWKSLDLKKLAAARQAAEKLAAALEALRQTTPRSSERIAINRRRLDAASTAQWLDRIAKIREAN